MCVDDAHLVTEDGDMVVSAFVKLCRRYKLNVNATKNKVIVVKGEETSLNAVWKEAEEL